VSSHPIRQIFHVSKIFNVVIVGKVPSVELTANKFICLINI
jgi:hypothetical protein